MGVKPIVSLFVLTLGGACQSAPQSQVIWPEPTEPTPPSKLGTPWQPRCEPQGPDEGPNEEVAKYLRCHGEHLTSLRFELGEVEPSNRELARSEIAEHRAQPVADPQPGWPKYIVRGTHLPTEAAAVGHARANAARALLIEAGVSSAQILSDAVEVEISEGLPLPPDTPPETMFASVLVVFAIDCLL